jgi:hypothetical protein
MPPVAARDRAAASRPGASLTAVGGTAITRRRALAIGAAAGLGTLLGPLRCVPALARRPAEPRGFGLTVTPADFAGSRTSRVLRAPRRFDLLGLRGAGHVEVRVRTRGGAWSDWVPLAVHGDHAPDTGTGERASDPVWTGGSDELQLRAARAPRRSLRVHLVAVPAAARRRAARRSAGARAAQAGGVQPGSPPPIVPRSAWGADALPPRSSPSYGTVQAAFVHHTVTANEYGPQDSAAIVLGIHTFHRDTNGWNDIGYNFLVDRYGQVFEGRAGGVDQPVVGAQAQGYNAQSTGVAVIGTHSAAPITEQAMAALAQLLGWKLSLHGVPAEGTVVVPSGGGSSNRFPAGTPVTLNRISGHRDGDSTSCPGDALYAQLPVLRPRAAALAGPVVAPAGLVTLAVAAPNVPYGQAAAFAGIVTRPGGVAAGGEPVAVQKRTSRGTWVTVARAAAAPDGTWATKVPWRRSGEVRARAAGTSSKVASVAVVPLVKLRTPRSRRVPAGGLLRLSGRVRPALPVRVLVEFRGGDGRWRRVRLVRARVSGTNFGTTIRMRRPGLYRLTPRTVGPGDRTTGAPLLVRVVRGRR